jgi:HEAT repeat protein
VVVQTESLTAPLKYRKEQVLQVVSEATPLKEYLIKRDQTGKSAHDQFELGQWCESEKLSAYAELHYRKAIEADPQFSEAHRKLGHTQYGDRWLTTDELREAQGLVKVKGKWVSREEKTKLEVEEAHLKGQAAWRARLKVLRQALLFGTPEKQRDAEGQLNAIRDPVAIRPLVQVFGEDPDPVRSLLARFLGGIPGPEASSALVGRVLAESDGAVRQATLEEVARRPETEVIPQLVRALRSRDLAQINRAAWALGNLNAVSSVPKLIPALVMQEQQLVWVPTETTVTESSGGTFFSGTSTPWPIINSVATAPGAIAFGATSVPLYTGSGISYGGGQSTQRSMQPRFVTSTYRNTEVLSALERLTGQHFGYDPAAWRQWVNTSFRPDPEPARRVPQP